MKSLNIGVLAFHGDVDEHINALRNAAKNLRLNVDVILVRTKEALHQLDALILPGGESTTLQKLCEREEMFEEMKKIKNIFGTCAGAILLSKTIYHKMAGQKTLQLMNITIDRNAYGKQKDSFEQEIKTDLGKINAVFIRAPKIKSIGKQVKVLAKHKTEVLCCEQKVGSHYYLATAFHPELTSTIFHEYFLKQVILTPGI